MFAGLDDVNAIMGRRKRAIEQYEGMDVDRDHLNDAREIEVGLHSERNQPLHGPLTPGKARVSRGAIRFAWNTEIVDPNVYKPKGTVGGKYTMNTPKKMKLTVEMGNGSHDQSKFKMNSSCKPHLHMLDDSKIKIPTLFSKKKVKK
jgi:hypothetical protein